MKFGTSLRIWTQGAILRRSRRCFFEKFEIKRFSGKCNSANKPGSTFLVSPDLHYLLLTIQRFTRFAFVELNVFQQRQEDLHTTRAIDNILRKKKYLIVLLYEHCHQLLAMCGLQDRGLETLLNRTKVVNKGFANTKGFCGSPVISGTE